MNKTYALWTIDSKQKAMNYVNWYESKKQMQTIMKECDFRVFQALDIKLPQYLWNEKNLIDYLNREYHCDFSMAMNITISLLDLLQTGKLQKF